VPVSSAAQLLVWPSLGSPGYRLWLPARLAARQRPLSIIWVTIGVPNSRSFVEDTLLGAGTGAIGGVFVGSVAGVMSSASPGVASGIVPPLQMSEQVLGATVGIFTTSAANAVDAFYISAR